VSVDLLLGRRFSTFKETPRYIGAVQLDPSIWGALDIWEHKEQDEFILPPGGFVLAQTLETVCLPNNLAGLVEGRSSYARLGISVHVTAPKIDPGFEGTITLEMANHGTLPLKLRAGVDKPAQLMLLQISQPLEADHLYGKGPADLFQHQKRPIPKLRKRR